MEKTVNNQYPSLEQLQTELEREKNKGRYSKALRSTVCILIVVAAASVLLVTLFFPVFRIYGSSMAPTVSEGELVLAFKGRNFRCGDIIVLDYNNKLLVKRAIAGPGQWVNIDAQGNVFVDGELLEEPYLPQKALGDCTLTLPYQVPAERYFVLGDNRSTSLDSRSTAVGCIAKEQIIGKVILRIWPISEAGVLNRDL